MIVDAKVPLLGTMTTKSWAYGNKYRFDVNMMGDSFISWDDGVSLWEYRSDKNEVEIKRKEAKEASESAENGDAELFISYLLRSWRSSLRWLPVSA